MSSFVEQATLKIVDQSTGQIKKINAALKDLFKTAKSLKSTKIDIAVKETGTKQAIHALRKLNRELAKLKGNANLGINVKGLKQANAAARQMSQSMRQMQSSRKPIGTGTADAMRTQQRAAAGAARVQQRAAAGAARVQQRTAAAAAKTEQLKFPAFRRPLGTGTGTTDAARLARRTESSKAARMQARVDAPFPAYRRPIGAGTAEAMRGQKRRADSAERGGAASGAARTPKPTRHDSFTKRIAHEIPQDIVRGGVHKVIDTTVDAAKSGFWEEESARFRLRSRQETPERQGQIESAVRAIGEDMEKGGGRFYNPAQTTKLFLEALGQTAGDIEGAEHLTRRAIESTRARVGAGVPLEKAEEDAAQLIKAGDLRDAFYSVRRDASGKAVKDSGGRVIEDVDHKGIDEFYNNVNKVATVMGEQDFSGANVKQITKYLRASKEALTESAYNRTLFMGESMGTSAGVGLTQAQRMFRGQTTKATQNQLLQMGLLKQVGGTKKSPVFAPAEGGQTEIQDPEDPTKRISVAADLARNPYRHLHRAMDVMEQQGIDLSDRAAVTARLQRLGGTSTAQDWGIEAALRRRNLDQKESMAARIKGDSAAMDRNARDSPHLKLVAAEQQLKSTLGNVFSAAAPYLVDNVIDPIRKRAAEMTDKARAGEKVDWSDLLAGGGAAAAAFGTYNALKGIQKGDAGGLSSAGFSLLQAGSSLSAAATTLAGIPALLTPAAIGAATAAAMAGAIADSKSKTTQKQVSEDLDQANKDIENWNRRFGLKPKAETYGPEEPYGPPTGPEAPGVKKGNIRLKAFGAKPATKPTLWPMGTEPEGPEETYGPPTPDPKALRKMMKSFYEREKKSFAGPGKRSATKIVLTKPQIAASSAEVPTPPAAGAPRGLLDEKKPTGFDVAGALKDIKEVSAPGATINATGATIDQGAAPTAPEGGGLPVAQPWLQSLVGTISGAIKEALSVGGAQAAEGGKKPAAEGAQVAQQTVNAGSVTVNGGEVKASAAGEGAGAAQPGGATDLSAQIAQLAQAATALGSSTTALATAGTAVGTSISTSATSLAAAGTTIGTAISNAGTSLASSLQTGVSALTNAGTSIGAAISNAGTSLQGAVATAAASFQQASSAIAQGGAAAAASLQAGAASVAASGATAAAGLQQGAAAVAASGSQAAGALQGAAPGIGAAIGASAASAIRSATANISINVKHSGLTGTDTGGQKPD